MKKFSGAIVAILMAIGLYAGGEMLAGSKAKAGCYRPCSYVTKHVSYRPVVHYRTRVVYVPKYVTRRVVTYRRHVRYVRHYRPCRRRVVWRRHVVWRRDVVTNGCCR